MIRRIFGPVVVAALFTGSCFAENVEVDPAGETLVKSRLESGVVDLKKRQAAIRELFADAGCSVNEQRINKSFGNVICTLPGRTDSTIVVGGHFDFAEHGTGMVDDWSGVSLLPSLFQALRGRPREHTYVFVAFGAEERGLVGSSLYVRSLAPEQKALIRAFVNLECLGLAPMKVWLRRSTPALVTRLNEVATAIGVTLRAVNVDNVGDDDTHPFFSAQIPVISIHSLTQDTIRILHSERDRVDAIHFDDYYTSYKLAAYYLAYLDSTQLLVDESQDHSGIRRNP